MNKLVPAFLWKLQATFQPGARAQTTASRELKFWASRLQGYADAFESPTHVLAAITLLSAIAIFVFLGGNTKEGTPVSAAEAQPGD